MTIYSYYHLNPASKDSKDYTSDLKYLTLLRGKIVHICSNLSFLSPKITSIQPGKTVCRPSGLWQIGCAVFMMQGMQINSMYVFGSQQASKRPSELSHYMYNSVKALCKNF